MAIKNKITMASIKRKQLGYSQLELAEMIGISQAEISALENGFKVRRMDKIAEVLGMDVDDLQMSYEDHIRREVLSGSR